MGSRDLGLRWTWCSKVFIVFKTTEN